MSLQKPSDKILKLAKKWLEGTITPDEKNTFDEWYNSFDDTFLETTTAENEQVLKNRIHQAIFTQANLVPHAAKQKFNKGFWLSVAATILLVSTLGAVFYQRHHLQRLQYARIQKRDLLPGRNEAILTLANGRTVVLDDKAGGKVANEGNVVISKTHSGDLAYKSTAEAFSPTVINNTYNTLSIPRGGQYHLTLADGSQVWLNAASSITFPTQFSGNYRDVKITGEAYFEVAHNAAKPFRVVTNNQTVEVLGTHFDVNAYADEPSVKTTLLEGRVKVSKDNQVAVLRPGEQAQLKATNTGYAIAVNTVPDAEDVIAWKNGYFKFNQAPVESVMRQLSRWYDVEISYEGKLPDKTFSGSISRNNNASQLLEILSYTGLHFKIEDKKIIVTP